MTYKIRTANGESAVGLGEKEVVLKPGSASLDDTDNLVTEIGDEPGLVFVTYGTGASAKSGIFRVDAGAIVSVSANTDFSVTFETDTKLNVDITGNKLRVDNQLGTTQTIKYSKLTFEE